MTPTRRAVLLGVVSAGAASVAACTGQAPRPRPPDPDVALRAAAVMRETRLLAAYDAVAAAVPALAGRLRPLRAEHEEHLNALQAGPTPVAPSGAPSPSPLRDLAGLVQAERAAATAHAQAAALASRPLAALLASLAASEASHLVALR